MLVIDDQREDGDALKRSIGQQATVTVITPEELKSRHLRAADLVLVDYELGGWPGAGAAITSPPNGLALSAVVRERINTHGRGATGIALYSGEVGKISGTLPEEIRGFAVARLNNLEWVFEKSDEHAPARVISLAHAIQRLPSSWPHKASAASAHLHRLLELNPDSSFFDTAVDDISACHPPIHELSSTSNAVAVIRWIAQRILPYPGFLTDTFGLAARLRISVGELERLLAGKSELSTALESVEYRGVLSELYGRHWWRSGLDVLAFDWTSGAGGIDALHAAIEGLAQEKVDFFDQDVVPCIDETYRAIRLVPVGDALRIQLDDWPLFADDAWAERELVEGSDTLRGLVVASDAELLSHD